MERVLVIGCGGAGKTTLAKQLAALTGLPLVHLDSLFWKPGWVQTPDPEWAVAVEALAARPCWILDGNYSNSLALRLARADTVVFLDLPRRQCLWRALRRTLVGLGRTRADQAAGCREQISVGFFRWIWNFPRRSRPHIVEQLAGFAGQTLVLKSTAEVRAFLAASGAALRSTTPTGRSR